MTAKPGSKSIYLKRGDPWTMTIGPSMLDGVAEVIPDVDEILCQVRRDKEIGSPLMFDLATNAVLSAGGTVCTLSLSADETTDLIDELGEFAWDFQPDPDGETWMEGKATLDGEVSRPVES